MKKGFILGNPRSGTSLLRLMFNAHPKIIAPPESGFLHWWYEKYKFWSVQEGTSIKAIEAYVEDLLASKKIEGWHLQKQGLINFMFRKTPENYADLTTVVYEFYAKLQNCAPNLILDKNNYYIHHLKDLDKIWSDAHFIYLIRDGRDVACSYLNLKNIETDSVYRPQLSQNIETIAEEWNQNNLKIQNFLKTKNHSKYSMLRYEDLIQNPKKQLIPVVEKLGLHFSDKMLDYYHHNDEPISTLDWKMKTLSKPDPQNIGKYKSLLSKEEIKTINEIAEKVLVKGGYLEGGR